MTTATAMWSPRPGLVSVATTATVNSMDRQNSLSPPQKHVWGQDDFREFAHDAVIEKIRNEKIFHVFFGLKGSMGLLLYPASYQDMWELALPCNLSNLYPCPCPRVPMSKAVAVREPLTNSPDRGSIDRQLYEDKYYIYVYICALLCIMITQYYTYILMTGWCHLSLYLSSLVYYLSTLMTFSRISRIAIHYFESHLWQVEIEKFACNHWGKLFILGCLGGEICSWDVMGFTDETPDETPRLGLLTTCSPSYKLTLRNHAVKPRFVRIRISPWLDSQVVVVYLIFYNILHTCPTILIDL